MLAELGLHQQLMLHQLQEVVEVVVEHKKKFQDLVDLEEVETEEIQVIHQDLLMLPVGQPTLEVVEAEAKIMETVAQAVQV